MNILQPKSQKVQSSLDFKATHLKFNMNKMHVSDKVDLHIQIIEMVFKYSIQSIATLNKLHILVNKV